LAITVGLPAGARIATLRAEFLDCCDDLNLDATFEPARAWPLARVMAIPRPCVAAAFRASCRPSASWV